MKINKKQNNNNNIRAQGKINVSISLALVKQFKLIKSLIFIRKRTMTNHIRQNIDNVDKLLRGYQTVNDYNE